MKETAGQSLRAECDPPSMSMASLYLPLCTRLFLVCLGLDKHLCLRVCGCQHGTNVLITVGASVIAG